MTERFQPIFELTRGHITESIHYGAIVVVDSHGKLLFSYGDPQTVAFLRSSAKPFQALPFFERGGPKAFNLSTKEQALMCASHEGSDEHVRVVERIQAKTGIKESDLQCGIHLPGDAAAYKALIANGQAPTPNRNNCSGKHSGMLAHAKMRGLALDTYLDIHHPIQQDILTGFAEMCDTPNDKVEVGIDGCSAPNFAVPLYNSALAFARLCDPQSIQNVQRARAKACQEITEAMTGNPEMVSGYNEFDCRLMQAGKGQIVCKRGAEGFQAIGLLRGALGLNSPGIGITLKVTDGDPSFRKLDIVPHTRVRPAVTLEILRQIGALSEEQTKELAEFGPTLPVKNHRGIVVGESRPVFRLEANSPIVRALTRAARNGKQVAVLVEIKARFDEERNIAWASRLEEAGAIVIYGLARLKVHAKAALVVRREEGGSIRRYLHLSTGNYNDKTARLYADLSIFTANEDLCREASAFFNMVTGYSTVRELRYLAVAPFDLKARIIAMIERETQRSSPEAPGLIVAKMNSLADLDVISALYRASAAGVQVQLNVRGICMLVPGAKGLSENISVVSIVGRYLEHARIFYFRNGGSEEIYLASADWMPRNLERRIELMFPVLDDELRGRVRDTLLSYFRDNTKAHRLGPTGHWKRVSPAEGEAPFSVQAHFHETTVQRKNLQEEPPERELQVRRRPASGI